MSTFERIFQNLNLWETKQLGKQDKFSKVLSAINGLNKSILKFSFIGENESVEESLIPYSGTHGSRQQINKKLIQVLYNIWVLAEAYAYVV